MGKAAPQPQITPDPNLKMMQDRAEEDNIRALQARVRGDTASLMARYGTRLSLAGSMTPAAAV